MRTKLSTTTGTRRLIIPAAAPSTYVAWCRQRYIICRNLPLYTLLLQYIPFHTNDKCDHHHNSFAQNKRTKLNSYKTSRFI